MSWPIASVLLGTLATIAVAVLKAAPRRSEAANGRVFARATDMAEIRARLDNLEQAHHLLRAEIRGDIKELHEWIREAVGQ